MLHGHQDFARRGAINTLLPHMGANDEHRRQTVFGHIHRCAQANLQAQPFFAAVKAAPGLQALPRRGFLICCM